MCTLPDRKLICITALLAVMCFYIPAVAQESDTIPRSGIWYKAKTYNPARGRLIAFTTAGLYAGGMAALYTTWYKGYPSAEFHPFNDNSEWLQMDKVGHCASAYYMARWGSELVAWTGISRRKSALWGSGISYAFLLTIEMFDGYSDQWGFSTGDLIANTTGIGVFLGQEFLWKEQRISFKYSYHESELADQRPEIFGSSRLENSLKDYNGQTYWLSFNLASFLRKSKIPPWLNVAAGYGANNMLTASEGGDLKGQTYPGDRYRQFYISPDIEWTKIPVRSGALKTLFTILGFVKIPAPAIEYRSNGSWVFHGLYF